MLSQQVKDPPFIDIKTYITNYANHMCSKRERDSILSIIFEKPKGMHVVYMPFDYEWIIKPSYVPVTNALMKLSTVKTRLSMCDLKEKNGHFLKDHIGFLFKLLREGLMAYGCKKPPCVVDCFINEDTIIEIAEQVCRYVMVKP